MMIDGIYISPNGSINTVVRDIKKAVHIKTKEEKLEEQKRNEYKKICEEVAILWGVAKRLKDNNILESIKIASNIIYKDPTRLNLEILNTIKSLNIDKKLYNQEIKSLIISHIIKWTELHQATCKKYGLDTAYYTIKDRKKY